MILLSIGLFIVDQFIMKNLISKLLISILKEEDLRYASTGNTSGRSYADIERMVAQQENKVWGPEDVKIWFFQINSTKPEGSYLRTYSPHLGRSFGWDENPSIVAMQSNPDEEKRISYKPNVFVRGNDGQLVTGFVVAQNDKEALKLLDTKIQELRAHDQDMGSRYTKK